MKYSQEGICLILPLRRWAYPLYLYSSPLNQQRNENHLLRTNKRYTQSQQHNCICCSRWADDEHVILVYPRCLSLLPQFVYLQLAHGALSVWGMIEEPSHVHTINDKRFHRFLTIESFDNYRYCVMSWLNWKQGDSLEHVQEEFVPLQRKTNTCTRMTVYSCRCKTKVFSKTNATAYVRGSASNFKLWCSLLPAEQRQ